MTHHSTCWLVRLCRLSGAYSLLFSTAACPFHQSITSQSRFINSYFTAENSILFFRLFCLNLPLPLLPLSFSPPALSGFQSHLPQFQSSFRATLLFRFTLITAYSTRDFRAISHLAMFLLLSDEWMAPIGLDLMFHFKFLFLVGLLTMNISKCSVHRWRTGGVRSHFRASTDSTEEKTNIKVDPTVLCNITTWISNQNKVTKPVSPSPQSATGMRMN